MSTDDASPGPSTAIGQVLTRPAVRLIVGLVIPLLIAGHEMWQFREYIVDDAFISFRYAQNLVDGHGLVYNVGERIEGYTNLSWTLLLAGALAAGIDPDWFSTALGAVFGLGTIVVTYRIAERLRPEGSLPCVATWLLATSPGLLGHSVFGLETSMFAFLLGAGVLAYLREESEDRRWPWSGLVFALAALTRPEAPLFLGLMMLHFGGQPLLRLSAVARLGQRLFGGEDHQWRGPALYLGILSASVGLTLVQRATARDESMILSGALLGAGVVLVLLTVPRSLLGRRNLVRTELFLLPVAIHLVWRFQYYGRWLPNTLTAKTGDFGRQFADGVRYFDFYIDAVEGPLVWLVFAACGLAIALREPTRLAFASTFAAFCSYVMVVGGDWMLLGRYFVPLLPMFYLLLGLSARHLLGLHRATLWAVVLIVPFVVGQRREALRYNHEIVTDERAYWDEVAGGVAGWFLEQQREHGEAVRGTIAMGDIGRIGWVSGFPVFDVLGLVDGTTAAASGGYRSRVGDDFLEHFYEVAPRYFISESNKGHCRESSPPVLRAIQKDPRFAASYQMRASFRGKSRKHVRWCIFERRP